MTPFYCASRWWIIVLVLATTFGSSSPAAANEKTQHSNPYKSKVSGVKRQLPSEPLKTAPKAVPIQKAEEFANPTLTFFDQTEVSRSASPKLESTLSAEEEKPEKLAETTKKPLGKANISLKIIEQATHNKAKKLNPIPKQTTATGGTTANITTVKKSPQKKGNKTPQSIKPNLAKPEISPESIQHQQNLTAAKGLTLPVADDWIEFTFNQNDPMRVKFNRGKIIIELKPHAGEGELDLAERVLLRGSRDVKKIENYTKGKILLENRFMQFAFHELNPTLQGAALKALFPRDTAENTGLKHQIHFAGESLSLVVSLFAKDLLNSNTLARQNNLHSSQSQLKIGDALVIHWENLRDDLDLKPISLKTPLTLKSDKNGKRYAYYKMQKGEALYSSVVIRFTGRDLAEDVNEITDELMALNKIPDATRIMQDQAIKIPLDWLSEEYLQLNAPAAKEKPILPKLTVKQDSPLHVILDAGHGGLDSGASHALREFGEGAFGAVKEEFIHEDELVYDVILRLQDLLKKRGIIVHLTRQNAGQNSPVEILTSVKTAKEYLNTTPPYTINNSNYGINLRVLLINSLYENLVKREKIPKENIVFMSVHGDGLHPSIRGATVYYPDARLRSHDFKVRGSVYQSRKEFRPVIRYPEEDNAVAMENSRDFGQNIIAGLKYYDLPRIQTSPLRGNHYRNGKLTLPGVLRYSKVPISVLVEIANLNNAQDVQDVLRAKTRQKIAAALAQAVQKHFQQVSSDKIAKQ